MFRTRNALTANKNARVSAGVFIVAMWRLWPLRIGTFGIGDEPGERRFLVDRGGSRRTSQIARPAAGDRDDSIVWRSCRATSGYCSSPGIDNGCPAYARHALGQAGDKLDSMKVLTYEAIVERGEVKLPETVRLLYTTGRFCDLKCSMRCITAVMASRTRSPMASSMSSFTSHFCRRHARRKRGAAMQSATERERRRIADDACDRPTWRSHSGNGRSVLMAALPRCSESIAGSPIRRGYRDCRGT